MGSRSQHSAPKHYGAPLSTPKPGGTTRKRPKVGDKDASYDPNKKVRRVPHPAAPKPKKHVPTFISRDYRGVDGAVEDAVKGRKK